MIYVIQNAHWFILLLGALVCFHELGHFLVAKACGIKVLKFSLGFGPRIFGFVRGETEYRIGLLPLGGYVKMLGELPGADIPPQDAQRSFIAKPWWQRCAVVLGGPVFNLVLAVLIYWAMFIGTQTFGATKLGAVRVGDPAWNAGLRPGDTITAVDGNPVGKWSDLRDLIGNQPGETLSVHYRRNGKDLTAQLTPASHQEQSPLLQLETRGRIGVSFQYLKPIIAVVDPKSPAALAGLLDGDIIETVGDDAIKVQAWHEMRQAIKGLPAHRPIVLGVRRGDDVLKISLTATTQMPPGLDSDLLSAADTPWGYTGLVSGDTVIASVEEGTPAQQAGLQVGDRLVHLAIDKRDGTHLERPVGVWGIDLAVFSGVDARSKFTLKVQRGRALLERTFELEAREEKDELKNKQTRYVFGARNAQNIAAIYTFERNVGFFEAGYEAVKQTAQDASLITQGIGMLLGGHLSLDTMGGPIMLFFIAEQSAKRGIDYFLRVMAVISVNLGILNLLPLPVLDGGHLMFFAIEAIRRKPASIRTRGIANTVGLVLLLMLMVLVFHNDFIKYILG